MGSHSSTLTPAATVTSVRVSTVTPLATISVIPSSRPAPQVITSPLPTTVMVTQTESIIESVIITQTASQVSVPQPAAATSTPAASAPQSATASPQRAAASGKARGSAVSPSAGSVPTLVPGQKLVGPFASPDAILGGVPSTNLDVPVTVIFLLLFISGAATHFTIHEVNGKRGHKFHLSDLLFDFCMVRTVTCTMRIVWAFRPNNQSIVLAALIFEGAGVVVIFAVNLFFTQRIIRSIHPKAGWSPPLTGLFLLLVITAPTIILWNITNTVLASFLLKPNQLETVHDLLLFGGSYVLFLGSAPMTFLAILALFPPSSPPEKFGMGALQVKIVILLAASALLTVGAVIRLVVAANPAPLEAPQPLESKAVFYITGFTMEITVVILYAVSRVDLRFYVPDGCTKPGDYINKPNSPLLDPVGAAAAKEAELGIKDEFGSQEDLIGTKKRANIRENEYYDPNIEKIRQQRELSKRGSTTHQQVRDTMVGLGLNSELVGRSDAGGGEEILLYSVRVKKGESVPGMRSRTGQPLQSSMGTRGALVRNGILPMSPMSPYGGAMRRDSNGAPMSSMSPYSSSVMRRSGVIGGSGHMRVPSYPGQDQDRVSYYGAPSQTIPRRPLRGDEYEDEKSVV